MTRIELKQSLFIIFPLAAASLAIWLFEITKIIGWKSLQWLETELFAPYIICCLAAACFMTPMMLKYRKIDGKIILTFLTFSLINVIAFFLAEVFFKGIYNRADLAGNKYVFYLLGVMTFLGFSIGYQLVTHYLIVNMPKLFALVFATSEILMFLLAIITVYFIRGFGSNYGFVDAVKMGYPQFWVCILLGLSGVFILAKNAERAEN